MEKDKEYTQMRLDLPERAGGSELRTKKQISQRKAQLQNKIAFWKDYMIKAERDYQRLIPRQAAYAKIAETDKGGWMDGEWVKKEFATSITQFLTNHNRRMREAAALIENARQELEKLS